MAYEHMTYEYIMNRMMERVISAYPNLDKREGSILFNALAAAGMELAIAYTEVENSRDESFVDTASREYIMLACKQIGLDTERFKAHAGTFKGEFDVEVSIGSRWNCELYNYQITEFLGMNGNYYTYEMVCETTGTAPNTVTGHLSAITELPSNLNYAQLTECLIEGENESTDDEVREAFYDYINATASDGNVGQYQRWCLEYTGVGNHKIFPLWNGANTVKVSILSASNTTASDELVRDFQNYLDPNTEGMGNGVAPIGAFVTVTTATEVPISVSATVMMKTGHTDLTVLNKALESYFREISYEKAIVSYMNVGAALLNAEGVEFVTDLKMNGDTKDIVLGNEEIPVVNTTSWTESE